MSYQVLARKWRPKIFQEVVGQEHITRSLQNAIIQNRLGHAYVLTGTRGIGKTSVARIFAKALSCQQIAADGNPCNKCSNCLSIDSGTSMDVLEIDGASNNSVDNIRSLIENVHYPPIQGKYKVYIIDEVHMLSTQAFNALLKTLEEPPEHVLFIFATTEPHKLLGTVLSRCQRFDFRMASVKDLVSHIKKIAVIEKIEFANETLVEQIAKQGRGSIRDTLSLLDQVLSFTVDYKISEDVLVMSLGLARSSFINNLVNALFAGDLANLKSIYLSLINENTAPKSIIMMVLDHIFNIIQNMGNLKKRQSYIDDDLYNQLSMAEIFWVYESLAKDATWSLNSIDPVKVLEILLQKLTQRREFLNSKIPLLKKKEFDRESEDLEQVIEIKSSLTEDAAKVLPKIDETWDGFLKFLTTKNAALASNLEHGNIIGSLEIKQRPLSLNLGFSEDARVFFDYIVEGDVKLRILESLSDFFQIDKADIDLQINIVDKEQSFISKADLIKLEQEEKIKIMKDQLINDPLVKQAEDLFKSKIDKIIIDEK